MKIRAERGCDRLFLPVYEGIETQKLNIFSQGVRKYEFDVVPEGKLLYETTLPLAEGEELELNGTFPDNFWEQVHIGCAAEESQPETGSRPAVHFTARVGWINDPNGLVYQDGTYHLYYQYNPFGVQWGNMCWGHATSRDLLHWSEEAVAMYPDENGTMYSGSGIRNDRGMLGFPADALLFFYTAAGGRNAWSGDRLFTQRMAYSLDGGHTLQKTNRGMVSTIGDDSRDPKVFWHEESQSYVMVLWLVGNEFGILRSTDLESWKLSDRVTLPEAWECPDLVCLTEENGEKHWAFSSADGYYFWGKFDGYHFTPEEGDTFVQHMLYATRVAYAAQTYSGVPGRTVFVPWLRLPNAGRNYTGGMGIPRELSAHRGADGSLRIAARPVVEWSANKVDARMESEQVLWKNAAVQAMELDVHYEADDVMAWRINGTEITLDASNEILTVGSESIALTSKSDTLELLIDGGILEVTGEDGCLVAMFELAENTTCIERLSGDITKMHLYTT